MTRGPNTQDLTRRFALRHFRAGRTIAEIVEQTKLTPAEVETYIRESLNGCEEYNLELFEKLKLTEPRQPVGAAGCQHRNKDCVGGLRGVDWDGENNCVFLLCQYHAQEYWRKP
jgi:hypothetical protein